MEEEKGNTEENVLDIMTPIWKENANLPATDATLLLPLGRKLKKEEVWDISLSTIDNSDDDSHPPEFKGMSVNDVISQTGFVLVRRDNVSEDEKSAVSKVLKSPTKPIERLSDQPGYYYAPSIMTKDMIRLDVAGFSVLRDSCSPKTKSNVMPTFHSTVTVNSEEKDEILYLPSMAGAPVGVLFLTEGRIKVLRAPYVHMDESDGEEEEEEPQRIICAEILDNALFPEHPKEENNVFGACSTVSEEMKEELEQHGDEIWTTLDFKPHDVFACLRGTLFKLEPKSPTESVSGKLLAAIQNPTKKKYSRIIDVRAALTTGIIKLERWGVPFMGDKPPTNLSIGLDDVLANAKDLVAHFPRRSMLEVPFHQFTTTRNWSSKFGKKSYNEHNDILTFSDTMKEFPILIQKIDDVNKRALSLKNRISIAESKKRKMEKAYNVQKVRFSLEQMLTPKSLFEKLEAMKVLIQKSEDELEHLEANAVQRESLRVELEEIINNVDEEKIDAKSVKLSIATTKKRLVECDNLPSDSRIKTLTHTLATLKKNVTAAKEKKERGKRKREELQNGNNDGVPDPETYCPDPTIVEGVKLLECLQSLFFRQSRLAKDWSGRCYARRKKEQIVDAQKKVESLQKKGKEQADIDSNLLELANTKLSKEEKIAVEPFVDEDAFKKLLTISKDQYRAANKCLTDETSYDLSKLIWSLDRLECWPENPFTTSKKIGADPMKRKKYCQTTLDGKKVEISTDLIECPNDDECDNTEFISENCRKKLRLGSRCLTCEGDHLVCPIQQDYNKISSAVESNHPLVENLQGERWDKITWLMNKIDKEYDLVYRTPAVKKTHSEPKIWKLLAERCDKIRNILKSLPLDELPKPKGAYVSSRHDENFVPLCDQFQSEPCDVCDSLLIHGVCADCGSKEESEEESEEERKSKKKRPRDSDNKKETQSAEYHITQAILAANDPVVKEALQSSLKRLKHKEVEYVERFVMFIAHDQVIINGEVEFDKTTAIRFGTKDFLTEEEARLYAKEEWGYDQEKQPFFFFRKITTTK